MWHRITRGAAITGMVGLRRRCASRNDGMGQIIYHSKVTSYTREIKCQTTA
ncbi:MAG: hypothetical protein HON55_05115 [Legionellales bacterium]|nr:hypothetical protein [Legionellales bacterium]